MSLCDEPSRKPLPKDPVLEDHRRSAIKGALGAIPVLGSVLAEELGLLLAPPLTRRRDEWFEDLARRLHDLENRVEGFRFDKLDENEEFVSAIALATQAALRTHQQEKRSALRNAVLNTVLGNGGVEERQAIFFSLLDRFTQAHLRMLKFFDKPKGGIPRTPISEVIGLTQSEISELRSLGDHVVGLLFEDLNRAGLVNTTEDQQRVIAPNHRWTSALGHELLEFITAPRELNEQQT